MLSQTQAGAPVDLLLLADEHMASELDPTRILRECTIASNQLVVIQPTKQESQSWDDLKPSTTTLVVANPVTAPLGVYTEQALQQRSIGARRIVVKDATAVLSAVALGHGDFGVVYRTDLTRSQQVKLAFELPKTSHDPIRYQMVLLRPGNPSAGLLYDYLVSDRGRKRLLDGGFTLAKPDRSVE
jgi:molybdate transport system substrate-binding protein